MKIGQKDFEFDGKHTYVMGILNVTPDSFSDGGKFREMDGALRHVEEMVEDGADIIDVGGESTRPGYQAISIREETARVISVLEEMKKRFDVPVSVDTYKASVMDAALSAGADLANDIWGLRYETLFSQEEREWGGDTMAEVVARHHKPVCIMQNRRAAIYHEGLLPGMMADMEESIRIGEGAGISREQMILDPGVGFGKTYEHNLQVLSHLGDFKAFHMPLLLAASRKSVIGLTLDLPVTEREEGTLVTTVQAVQSGWQMVRVHDVKKSVRAIRMMEKILEYGYSMP